MEAEVPETHGVVFAGCEEKVFVQGRYGDYREGVGFVRRLVPFLEVELMEL